VDDYIARREAARANGDPLPTLPQAGAYASGGSMVVSIHAEARLEDGTYFARDAVALLRPSPRKPVTFVAWRESTAPSPAAQAAAAPAVPTQGASS